MFDLMDTDKDGKLSFEEFDRGMNHDLVRKVVVVVCGMTERVCVLRFGLYFGSLFVCITAICDSLHSFSLLLSFFSLFFISFCFSPSVSLSLSHTLSVSQYLVLGDDELSSLMDFIGVFVDDSTGDLFVPWVSFLDFCLERVG